MTASRIVKCVIITVAVVLYSSLLSAQEEATYYFTKNGRECAKDSAAFYRKTKLVDFSDKTYAYEEYSMDGVLQSTGFYMLGLPYLITGAYVEYYENGVESIRGTYLSDADKHIWGQKVNNWYYRYKNDSLKLEKLYALDTITNSFKPFIINYWDTTGVQKVIDGNGDYVIAEQLRFDKDSVEEIIFSGKVKDGLMDGVWKGFHKDGTLYCEEIYSTNGLVKGKSYDRYGKMYTYTKTESNPEYKGGEGALIRFLQWNIEYPWKERSKNIHGKVLVRFVVNEEGRVKDAIITRSVSSGLDKEALRVVNKLPDFKPGTQRGQPVSIYYNLPVVFKLN